MLERLKAALRERKGDDKGFSLVELAVVIVIIGILIAIAVPIFANMQKSAREADIKAAAANGSAIVASNLAAGGTITAGLNKLETNNVNAPTVTGNRLDNYCVRATGKTAGDAAASKGPGCAS